MSRRVKKHRRKKAGRSPLRRLRRGRALLGITVAGAIAAFIVLLVVSVASEGGGGGIERLEGISSQGRTLGSASAPVTIIEFADFQCTHCKDFAETTAGEIEEAYVANDLVRVEFRNMAVLGGESVLAAEAALCAEEQDAFWPYHDELFERQRAPNSGGFSPDRLRQIAADLGLEAAAFGECLSSERYEQQVVDETEAGQEAGAEGTPFFVVVAGDDTSGDTVDGARPFSEFARVIDRKLEEAAGPS